MLADGQNQPPEPPYYAVIFTSQLRLSDANYKAMDERLFALVERHPGFLGLWSQSDDNGRGVTISYFRDLASIKAWKDTIEHLEAQRQGQEKWYERYAIKIARVERAYEWRRS